ncbi:hypothetical protein ACFW4T_28595 [Streptomyces mutabilis]|uniref:hypothetical protein n=1 Tax=Streptomyces mutabilis TaxID=67332 RepID=UPI0036BF52AB
MINEKDKQYVAEFTAVVGDVLVDAPGFSTQQTELFGACQAEARRRGLAFMPMGAFVRLLRATGYPRLARLRAVANIRVRAAYAEVPSTTRRM